MVQAWRKSPKRYFGVLIALVVVCAYLGVTEPAFLTWDNFVNIIKANTVLLILAVGMTFVLLTAGIDLSVASLTVLCLMIFGHLVNAGWSWLPLLLAVIATGALLGLINGFLIGVVEISFPVVTLGTLAIYQSVALLSSDGEVLSLFGASNFTIFDDFVNNDLGPIPLLALVCLVVVLLAGAVLRYTRYGRAVYAVGSNPEAARLTGIRVTLVIVSVYTLVGACAGLASIVLGSRLTAAAPQADPTLLLTVVAAVLIGGTSFTGGEGGVIGTVVGVLFLGVVQNGLALSDVSTFWQGTVSGTILIVAVGLNVVRDKGWLKRGRTGPAPPETDEGPGRSRRRAVA